MTMVLTHDQQIFQALLKNVIYCCAIFATCLVLHLSLGRHWWRFIEVEPHYLLIALLHSTGWYPSTVLIVSPTVTNSLICNDGIPSQYWTSCTVLIVSPYSIKHPPMCLCIPTHYWTSSTVLITSSLTALDILHSRYCTYVTQDENFSTVKRQKQWLPSFPDLQSLTY